MNIFFNELKPFYNIIDIRDSESYNLGHAYNAINIPYERLLNNPSYYLKKEDKYYIYCKSGIRSKKVCELLRLLNYNVVNVIDGYGK